jgi:outer membrane protein TolC
MRPVLAFLRRQTITCALLATCGLSLSAAEEEAGTVSAATSRPITIEEAVQIALQGNLGLAVEVFNRDFARETVNIADAEFQPVFQVSARQGVNQQAASSSDLDGADRPRSEGLRTNAAVSQKINTGATVSLSSNLGRSESNSVFADSITYDADIALSVRQPLLSGAGSAVNRANRERARIGVERSDLGYVARALDVVSATEISFFDLDFAMRNLDVQRRGLEVAETFLAENEARQRAGLATELDIMQARVGVANRRSLILTAEQRLRAARTAQHRAVLWPRPRRRPRHPPHPGPDPAGPDRRHRGRERKAAPPRSRRRRRFLGPRRLDDRQRHRGGAARRRL